MNPRLPVDAAQSGALYRREALLALGFHPRRIAGPEFIRVLPGMWTRSDAPTPLLGIARAAQKFVCPRTAISHVTAAEIIGAPLPFTLGYTIGGPIHCRSADQKAMTGPLLVRHRMRKAPTFMFQGIVLSHPMVVAQEIAPVLDHPERVAYLDSLASGRGTVVRLQLSEIREIAGRLHGRGAALVRNAADDARANVWSPMETRTRLLLLECGYPEPVYNHRVHDPVTDRDFYLDLAYPDWKIAIEYDGDGHRTDRRRFRADHHKDQVLKRLGWNVLRITHLGYRDPADFLLQLDAAISMASAR